MPLPSLLAALGYGTADSFRGAQWPFWLLAGLLPLLTFAISLKLSGERWQAWTAALFTVAGGFYAHWLSQPATFAPFAWAGGLGLYAMAQGSRGAKGWKRWVWWLLAGVMAGVAHLTRADGVLLLLVGVWVWLLGRGGRRKLIERFQSLGLLILGYLLVMGGWFIRNWQVLGRPLPTVGTQTIFLRDYDDLFAYGRSFDLQFFLDWGWGNIIQSKLSGLSVAGQTFIAVSGLIFLVPFIVWAWWRLGRGEKREWLRPFTWYTLALYGTMSLVFTLPGERGGLFHSSAAMWPWMMALAAAGIGLAVDWFAARLPHWQPERAKRLFSIIFVVIAFVLSFFIGLARADSDQLGQIYEAIGSQLPPDAVVMVGDAPGFYYHTGITAVSIPNEPIDVLLQAAAQYGVTFLVLDINHPKPLAEIFEKAEEMVDFPKITFVEQYDITDLEGSTLPVYLYRIEP
jgi:4-amino-4-deoxy-L-arabinose transferase-like glycosyltransferase